MTIVTNIRRSLGLGSLALALTFSLTACGSTAGLDGTPGAPGMTGETGPAGPAGPMGTAGAVGSSSGRTVYAVDGANMLLSFGVLRPDLVTTPRAITGLQTGESIIGIDFRPVDSKLYGLGSTSRIYTIDVQTGAATAVSATPFTPALGANATTGFDFNPVADRIRIHTDTDQNLRINPADGVATMDTAVSYPIGDAGVGSNPQLSGTAYTNSVAGATTTVLYAIDAQRDTLVRIDTPNNGTLTTVGNLGVNTTADVGFDIAGNNGAAYVSLTVTGLGAGGTGSTLYQINPTSGALFILGNVSNTSPLRSIAIAP